MIIKLGENFGGVFGGKRGVLRLNLNVSLPLRFFAFGEKTEQSKIEIRNLIVA